jgi:hypothetical protein
MTLVNAIESFEVSIPATSTAGTAITLPGTLFRPYRLSTIRTRERFRAMQTQQLHEGASLEGEAP